MSANSRIQEAESLLMPLYEVLLSELTRSLGSAELAAEVSQEAFGRAMRFCMKRGLPYRPLPWLRTIARNVWRTRCVRRRWREIVVPWDRLQHLAEQSQELAHERVAFGVDPEHLAAAIDALTPRIQHLVREHYYEGKSCALLSVEHGIDRRAVKSRLYRARKHIERNLRRMAGGQS